MASTINNMPIGAPATDDNGPVDAPGMRQARGRARRAAVLAAAHSLFAAHGFERTSLKAIARAAGITDAGLLFHFPTKGALLLAVIAAGDREERKLLDGLMQGAEGLAALQSLASWGEALERDPALTALDITLSAEHLQDVSEANSYYASRYERLRKHLASIFATARRAGDFKPDTNPMQEAVLMISALDGLRLQWILSKRKVSMARSMRAYVAATIERLSVRPPSRVGGETRRTS